MKKIVVKNPAGLPLISFAELKMAYEPNSLKEKKDRKVADLKAAILSMGFTIPFFLWKEGKYIADGAGRLLALDMLKYEGYDIPDLPYVPLEAKSKKEAKQLTLAISSQYGHVSEQSLAEFTLDMQEVDLSFVSISGLDLEQIEWKPKKIMPEKEKKPKGKTKMQHECPNCHFKFTTGKDES